MNEISRRKHLIYIYIYIFFFINVGKPLETRDIIYTRDLYVGGSVMLGAGFLFQTTRKPCCSLFVSFILEIRQLCQIENMNLLQSQWTDIYPVLKTLERAACDESFIVEKTGNLPTVT